MQEDFKAAVYATLEIKEKQRRRNEQ